MEVDGGGVPKPWEKVASSYKYAPFLVFFATWDAETYREVVANEMKFSYCRA